MKKWIAESLRAVIVGALLIVPMCAAFVFSMIELNKIALEKLSFERSCELFDSLGNCVRHELFPVDTSGFWILNLVLGVGIVAVCVWMLTQLSAARLVNCD